MSKIRFAEFVMSYFLLQAGLYMVYLVEHLDKLQEWVSYTKTERRNKAYMNTHVSKQMVLMVQSSHSPDLNPLDFYLWGHFKTLV